jgi:antitoxin VapB
VALNIRNTQVELLAVEVARITGETKTEAVRRALQDRKNRLVLENRKKVTLNASQKRDRIRQIKDYLEREVWPNIPADILGKKMTKREREEILGMQI